MAYSLLCSIDFVLGLICLHLPSKAAGQPEIHSAAAGGDIVGLRLLIDARADLEVKNAQGDAAVHLGTWNGHVPTIQALAEAKADLTSLNSEGNTPAHLAVFRGHSGVMRHLIEADVDLSTANVEGKTPAHFAFRHGSGHGGLGAADWLRMLADARARLDSEDAAGYSPAHIAARGNYMTSLRILAAAEANLDKMSAKSKPGAGDAVLTPAYQAVQQGHVGVLRFLKEVGVDLLQPIWSDGSGTLANTAASKGHSEVVRFFVEEARMDLKKDSPHGKQLIRSAGLFGHVEVLRLLVDARARVDPTSISMYAGHVSYIQVLRYFSTLGVDINGSAWHAVRVGQDSDAALRFLYEAGVDFHRVDSEGNTLAHLAAWTGNVEQLMYLGDSVFSMPELNKGNNEGNTAAHLAAFKGHPEAVRILANMGVNLGAQNNQSETPASIAISKRHHEVLRVLLEVSADGLLFHESHTQDAAVSSNSSFFNDSMRHSFTGAYSDEL